MRDRRRSLAATAVRAPAAAAPLGVPAVQWRGPRRLLSQPAPTDLPATVCELPAALLMAGGRSSRMRQDGNAQHKALRSLLGRPLLAWNLGALLAFGFRDIYIAYNSAEVALAEWIAGEAQTFARAAGARCTALVETTRLGTIGAAAHLPETAAHVLVTNADNLTDLPLAALAHHHLASTAAATLATHTEAFQMPFGRLDFAGGTVTGYHEKPEIRVPICSGTAVLSRRAIARIGPGLPVDLPALIQDLLQGGELVCAFAHESRWIDVNDEAALTAAAALLRSAGASWPGAAPWPSDAPTIERAHA